MGQPFRRRKKDGYSAGLHTELSGLCAFLSEESEPGLVENLRAAETIGRPPGHPKFLDMAERKTKRVLRPARRLPKPRGAREES